MAFWEKLGLSEGKGDDADERARALRATLEASLAHLSKLEAEEKRLLAREAALEASIKEALARGDRPRALELADSLTRHRKELASHRDDHRATRVAHEKALAILNAFDEEKERARKTREQPSAPDPKPASAGRIDVGGLARKAVSTAGRVSAVARDVWNELDASLQAATGNAASVAFARGDFPRAIEEYDKRLAANPRDAAALCDRGAARLNLGANELALADLDEAIRLDPKLAVAWSNRANARINLEHEARAIFADAEEALRLKPELSHARFPRGVARGMLGDLRGAVADYTEALAARPGWSRVYAYRGECKLLLGDLDGALADAEQAIAAAPGEALAWRIRARAQCAKKDLDAALASANEAVRLSPAYRLGYTVRSRIRRERGDVAGAAEDRARAFDLDPDPARAYAERADEKLEAGDFDGAIADADEALHRRPSAGALLTRADARRQKGDLPGALADLDEALREPSVNAQAMRALVRWLAGLPSLALEDADAVLRLFPRNAYVLWLRAEIRTDLGDLAGAIADLSEAISVEPGNARAWMFRGVVKAASGDRAGALADLEKGSALDANDAYPPLWCAGLGGDRARVEPFAGKDDWQARLARIVLGTLSHEDALAEAGKAATEKERDEHLCEALGFLGLVAEREGDLGRAFACYERCVETAARGFYEHGWARCRLAGRAAAMTGEERLTKLHASAVLTGEELEAARKLLAEGGPRVALSPLPSSTKKV